MDNQKACDHAATFRSFFLVLVAALVLYDVHVLDFDVRGRLLDPAG